MLDEVGGVDVVLGLYYIVVVECDWLCWCVWEDVVYWIEGV